MKQVATQIGTYHVREEREFDIPQCYAGYAERVLVSAGSYPLRVEKHRGREYLIVDLPGTTAYWYYGANDYGPHGNAAHPSRKHGALSSTHLQPWCHQVAEEALKPQGQYTLEGGWTSRHVGDLDNDPAKPMFGLFRPDGSRMIV